MMQQMRVSDLMRECPTAVIAEGAKLRDAAELLVTNEHSVLMVQDTTGRITGLICENTIVRELMHNSDRTATIDRVISRHVETVRSDASLRSVLHLFRSSCHAVIPIVDEQDAVVGQLHRSDVVRFLLDDGPAEVPQKSPGQRPHFLRSRPQRPAAAQPPRDRDSHGRS